MASYGIGPARIVAAAVEQFADERGISWPTALAPFAVHLVAMGKPGTPERDAAEGVYAKLLAGGVDVIYDDRDLGPGEKFADAELLGCPLRLTIGRRGLEAGEIEVQIRRGLKDAPPLALDSEPAELARAVDELWRTLPRDESAPKAPVRATAVRPRPLRAAAPRDARRRAAASVHGPQRDRDRAPGADPRVPRARPARARWQRSARRGPLRRDRLGRLRRRDRRARDRPVQPPRAR